MQKFTIDSHIDQVVVIYKIKKALDNCQIITTKALGMKIRRNYMFTDFCKKFKLPWVREKFGSIFSISFYGESVIGQGGI